MNSKGCQLNSWSAEPAKLRQKPILRHGNVPRHVRTQKTKKKRKDKVISNISLQLSRLLVSDSTGQVAGPSNFVARQDRGARLDNPPAYTPDCVVIRNSLK